MTSRGTLDEKLRCKSCPLGSVGRPLGGPRREGGQLPGPGHLSGAESGTDVLPFQVRGSFLEEARQEERVFLRCVDRWGRSKGASEQVQTWDLGQDSVELKDLVPGLDPLLRRLF